MTMAIPFNHLRSLAAVAEEGGVRAAARRLGIAHSAVSRSLGELEAIVGVAITRRRPKGRGIELTPEGRTLANASISAFAGVEAAIQSVSQPQNRNGVVIGTTASFATCWLFPRMIEFRQHHRDIEISVMAGRDVLSPQSQGADMSVRLGSGPWPEPGAIALCDDLLVPVASSDYLRSLGPRRDLRHMRLLHDRDPAAQWSDWVEAHGPADADHRSGPRFDSGDIVLRAAESGEGVALTRLSLARKSLGSGMLKLPFGALSLKRPDAIWLIPDPVRMKRGPVKKAVIWLQSALAAEAAENVVFLQTIARDKV